MRRGGNGFGPLPISWSEIEAWARLNRIRPTPGELECLGMLEAAYFTARAK